MDSWRHQDASDGPDRAKGNKCPYDVKLRSVERPKLRQLRDTLVTAVLQAFWPLPILRTLEYSRYLSHKVAGYTLGWQTFRVATETNYLLYHGFGFQTLVAQIFLACSLSSVLLSLLRRQLWLRWRERICIGMNCVYGTVTFLKVFYLVPRLPNENHYLFKHCLLTMADAFFCQVPVHKFYMAQVVDAALRCVVWRRYGVLPGAPMPVVILVSLAWQAWILLFSSMLQARHVSAYLRLKPLSPPQQQQLLLRQQQRALASVAEVAAAAGVEVAAAAGEKAGSSGGPPGDGTALAAGCDSGVRRSADRSCAAAPCLQLQADHTPPPPLPSLKNGAERSQAPPPPQAPVRPSTSPHQQPQPPSSSLLRARSPLAARSAGPASGATTATTTSDAATDASYSPGGALQPVAAADLMFARGSSGSTRTRSGPGCAVRLAYRVIAPGGGILSTEADATPGSADEPGPLSSCEEEHRRGGAAGDCDGLEETQEGKAGMVLEPLGCGKGLGRGGAGGLEELVYLEEGEDCRPPPIPMLSMVETCGGSSGEEATSAAAVAIASPGLDSVRATRRADAADAGAATDAGMVMPLRAVPSPSLQPTAVDIAALVNGGLGGRRSRQAEAALRRLVRGPSSYVLLAKQRERDQNVRTATSVQLVVSSAEPDQLVTQWRNKLAAAVAGSAPGWQLANASVRRGSLIVHLDLVYHPQLPYAAAAAAAVGGGGCDDLDYDDSGGAASVAAPPPQPSSSNRPAEEPPRPGDLLERFLAGLGPTGLLDALSMSDHAPASVADYISVQHGDRMLRYGVCIAQVQSDGALWLGGDGEIESAAALTPAEVAGLAGAETTAPRICNGGVPGGTGLGRAAQLRQRRRRVGAQLAAPAALFSSHGAGARGAMMGRRLVTASAELLDAARRHVAALYDTVHLALHPPPFVAGPDYANFLHARVASLQIAYTNLMTATMILFYASKRGMGLRLSNILAFMAPELLSVAGRAVTAAGGARGATAPAADGGGGAWAALRAPLVHVGVALRGLQMISTSLGIVPRISQVRNTVPGRPQFDDCAGMRWIMKMMLISALQVLCMQTPVRLTFAVRLLPLAGGIMSHLLVCHPDRSTLAGLALHLGWEAALLLLAATMQARHIAAYRLHRLSSAGASTASRSTYLSLALSPVPSCFALAADAAGGGGGGAAGGPHSAKAGNNSSSPKLFSTSSYSALAAALTAVDSSSDAFGFGGGSGNAPSSIASFLSAPPSEKSPPTPMSYIAGGDAAGEQTAPGSQSIPSLDLQWGSAGRWESVGGAATDAVATRRPSGFGANGGDGGYGGGADPVDITLDGCVLAMAPRRTTVLHVRFTCAASVVEELQVILRHVSPASMATGVHSATPASVITRTLAAPAAAHVRQIHESALRFEAELTMAAAPQDMPGVVHVELWRGRRRLAGWPVLLAAAAAALGDGDRPGGAAAAQQGAEGPAKSSAVAAALREGELPAWLLDVKAYMEAISAEGHASAADQFVEELGGWLAQLTALQRGFMTVSDAGPGSRPAVGGVPQPIARVLLVHRAGWQPPLPVARLPAAAGDDTAAVLPPPESRSGCGAAAAIRQLLLCQGQGLLAVAVEAGCLALSEELVAQLLGPLEGALRDVLEAAVTPVTGLPLLHAAVKSGCTQMVDLVVSWHMRAGNTDIWSREAVVRAVTLEPRHLPTGSARHGASAVPPLLPTAAQGVGAAVAAGEAAGNGFWAAATGSAAAAAASPPRILGTVAEEITMAIPGAAEAAATEAYEPPPPPLMILTRCADSAATAADAGRWDVDQLTFTSGSTWLAPGLAHMHGHDSGASFTGSFLLETGRQSLRQNTAYVPTLVPRPVSGSTPTAGTGPVPVPGAPQVAPPPLSPTPSRPPESVTCGSSFTAAAAATLAASYTTTGVSMAAAAAAAAERSSPSPQDCTPACGLSAPFKVVCFRTEAAAGGSSAVQVLPRDARDAKEPAAAGLLPGMLCDPRVVGVLPAGGPNEISNNNNYNNNNMWQSSVVPSATASPVVLAGHSPQLPQQSQGGLLHSGVSTRSAIAAPCGTALCSGSGGGSGSELPQRSSLESQLAFVDFELLLVTPLHVALALADEGRVATHIFAKYQEAHQLWGASQAQWGVPTAASNVASVLDSGTMASPFEMSALLAAAGPSSCCAASAAPLIPSGISLRRGSSTTLATNTTTAAASMAVGAMHQGSRHRMSGIGGWGSSAATLVQHGAGGGNGGVGGERTTPRGWLRMSGRAFSGLESGSVIGAVGGGGGGVCPSPGGGGSLLTPPQGLLGAIADVEREEEAVQSLPLAKMSFADPLRRMPLPGNSIQAPTSGPEE